MSQSATPATQNDMTTCLETFEKERFCSFPHRHGDATGRPKTRDETRGRSKTSMSCETSANFLHSRHVIKQVGLSQSATPATQNDMTTCLETFKKERFCSFPQRHGDATGKPETRDETIGRSKTSMSCETCANFDTLDTLSNRLECHKVPRLPRKTIWQPAWKPSKRRGFAASPRDTATPQENQRLETRHLGAAKRACRARLPPILTFSDILWHSLTFSTRYQTGWNVTKCHACHAKRHDNLLGNLQKERFCSFPHRHGDATGKPETWDETLGRSKTSMSCETCANFDILDTLSNRLECHKVPRLPRKTTWQPAWKPSQRRGFAASPRDTATPQENQRLETRHLGAAKRACRARLPPILTFSDILWHSLTFSTRYQTGWNVTKCHACHAKRHDDLLGNLQKGEVLQLPP